MKTEQRSEELYESVDLFILAWQAFAEEFEGAEVKKRENLFITWADTELPFYNTIFLTEAVNNASRFRLLAEEAVARDRRNTPHSSEKLRQIILKTTGQRQQR